MPEQPSPEQRRALLDEGRRKLEQWRSDIPEAGPEFQTLHMLLGACLDEVDRLGKENRDLHDIIHGISVGRRHGKHVFDRSKGSPARCSLCGYVEGDLPS